MASTSLKLKMLLVIERIDLQNSYNLYGEQVIKFLEQEPLHTIEYRKTSFILFKQVSLTPTENFYLTRIFV